MIKIHKAASNARSKGEIQRVCWGLLAKSMAVPYSSPAETIVAVSELCIRRSQLKRSRRRDEAIKGTLEPDNLCQRPQLSDHTLALSWLPSAGRFDLHFRIPTHHNHTNSFTFTFTSILNYNNVCNSLTYTHCSHCSHPTKVRKLLLRLLPLPHPLPSHRQQQCTTLPITPSQRTTIIPQPTAFCLF